MDEEILDLHKFPKRKRDEVDHDPQSVSSTPSTPSRPAMSIPEILSPDEVSVGRSSPQVAMTGQLKSLDIHGNAINIDDPTEGQHQAMDGQSPIHQGLAETPRRKSQSNSRSPTIATPTKSAKKRGPKTPTRENDSSGSPSRSPSTPQRGAQSRRKSPPLTTQPEENPLTWHDSEITGYDPTDPNDDGYGLNGVGFRPTAAVAWNRAQRRKKQITEWKYREEREERDKRRERRDGIVPERDKEDEGGDRKRVKFEV
ncbi:hypothetical protein PRK78_005983 [Emydomyces testavorans]|uniref:Uncharacterized protein n=1 Tax=Emydomyces testavorans TaxID=2070801 RepID=A0AAF0DKJ9_9EURO|nr:hypothetical protein PRK78_005983 [Emydomyces testavorans]